MPQIEWSAINPWAVLVAAGATFLIGGLWYSPLLFAQVWVKAHGFSEEQLRDMQTGAGPAYAGSVVCYLVMALVVAVLVQWTGITTAAGGAALGFVLWLGFAATIGMTALLFSDRKSATYWIDSGYQLVYLVLQGTVVGVWS